MNILTDEEIVAALNLPFESFRKTQAIEDVRAIESAVLSKLAEQDVRPVAHLRFWAAQYYAGYGDIEFDEGTEVTTRMEPGVDGSPAFPVFTEAQLIAAQQRTAEACAKVIRGEGTGFAEDDEELNRIAAMLVAGEWREYL